MSPVPCGCFPLLNAGSLLLRPGNGSQHQQDEDRERGMSPTVSQQWDYETMSTLSQPAVLDEPLEEAQKPGRCQLLGVHFKAAGGAPENCHHHLPDVRSWQQAMALAESLLCLCAQGADFWERL